MGVLSRIFPGFFNKFEESHNKILKAFEADKLSPQETIIELHVNAKDSLSINDPRRMDAFKAIFDVATTAFYDGKMTADEVGFAISYAAQDILRGDDFGRRREAFGEILYFWNHVYQEGDKTYTSGSVDLQTASRLICNSARAVLTKPDADLCVSLFRNVDRSEKFNIAFAKAESCFVPIAMKLERNPRPAPIFAPD